MNEGLPRDQKKSQAMSYIHKDREWLQKLQTMLRPMVRNTSNHFNRLASDPCPITYSLC
jgi:hypothetical protein